ESIPGADRQRVAPRELRDVRVKGGGDGDGNGRIRAAERHAIPVEERDGRRTRGARKFGLERDPIWTPEVVRQAELPHGQVWIRPTIERLELLKGRDGPARQGNRRPSSPILDDANSLALNRTAPSRVVDELAIDDRDGRRGRVGVPGRGLGPG